MCGLQGPTHEGASCSSGGQTSASFCNGGCLVELSSICWCWFVHAMFDQRERTFLWLFALLHVTSGSLLLAEVLEEEFSH